MAWNRYRLSGLHPKPSTLANTRRSVMSGHMAFSCGKYSPRETHPIREWAIHVPESASTQVDSNRRDIHIYSTHLCLCFPLGYRMPTPENTPPEMYRLMLKCWAADVDSRPHFDEIYNVVDALILRLDNSHWTGNMFLNFETYYSRGVINLA